MSWLLDAEPRPKILVLPPAAADLGEAEAAIELWEHYSRKRLDDTQRLAVQVMMAQGPGGKWAAATTGREMPRQNGKGDEIEVVELWGLVQRDEAILHTIHDAVLLATQTQQRMLGVLEGHADLRRRIKRKWQGTGQQMIEMRGGGVIWYRTRTGGGGRGIDYVDRLVVDEAQHATDQQIAALSPTMLANPNPQLNAMGTGGLPGQSGWWWGVRKRALSVDPGRFGYVGHTAESVFLDEDGRVVQEAVDVSDREQWIATNPAVAAGRGGALEFLEEQFRNLSSESFGQEHLCVWAPPGDMDDGGRWEVWPEAVWRACGTGEDAAAAARPGWLVGAVALAVEMPPDRSSTTIVAAGECREGGVGVEVVAQNPGRAWVSDHVAALKANPDRPVSRVVVDPRSPAGALIDALSEAGVEVTSCDTAEFTAATADLYDAVVERQLVHRNRAELDDAVAHATKRTVGDRWLLDRRTGVDISPITAAVLARWGHLLEADPPKAGARDYLLVM